MEPRRAARGTGPAAQPPTAVTSYLFRTAAPVHYSAVTEPANVGDTMSDRPSYYHHHDLGRFGEIARGSGELAGKFFDWYTAVFAEGALTAREKSLIALAVAHAVQCPYCIDAYSSDALEKGSNLDEMTEAVHVAAAIRGGASLVHGVQMLNRVDALGM
jgi:alkylhydroperoxidase/carboxymuconolactone decarboxylase family protein